jgi:acetylornithine deacetylase/succinyl-diaminopimelate desuccinylase-like protein
MDPLSLVPLARTLVDIDSTTGQEADCGRWLAAYLRGRGFSVEEQPVSGDRFNLAVTMDPPRVVLSTHFDCVPPFFPSREADGLLHGRGACDAKGILAAQVCALERLRAEGVRQVGALFLVGEERGSDGAHVANGSPNICRFLVNGEPTESRLAAATRGALRLKLTAHGRAGHSCYPETGESAIERLLDALVRLRSIELPAREPLGRTHYTVGLINGGLAPNVIPPHADAEVMFRTVGATAELMALLEPLRGLVDLDVVLDVPAMMLATVPGFDVAVFPFTTDIPFLDRWGTPLLFGPGTIRVAHTDHEHVSVAELDAAADRYVRLANTLLAKNMGDNEMKNEE